MSTPVRPGNTKINYRLGTNEGPGLWQRLFPPHPKALPKPPSDPIEDARYFSYPHTDLATAFATLLTGNAKKEKMIEAENPGPWRFIKDSLVPDPMGDLKIVKDGLSGKAGFMGVGLAVLVGASYIPGLKVAVGGLTKRLSRVASDHAARTFSKAGTRAPSTRAASRKPVKKVDVGSSTETKRRRPPRSVKEEFISHRAELKRRCLAKKKELRRSGKDLHSLDAALALDREVAQLPWPRRAGAGHGGQKLTPVFERARFTERTPKTFAALDEASEYFRKHFQDPNSRAIVIFYSPSWDQKYYYNMFRVGEGRIFDFGLTRDEMTKAVNHLPSDVVLAQISRVD